jgi:hypothetical protein
MNDTRLDVESLQAIRQREAETVPLSTNPAELDRRRLLVHVDALEHQLRKIRAHTAYSPGCPRELLEGLLASIVRICDETTLDLEMDKEIYDELERAVAPTWPTWRSRRYPTAALATRLMKLVAGQAARIRELEADVSKWHAAYMELKYPDGPPPYPPSKSQQKRFAAQKQRDEP